MQSHRLPRVVALVRLAQQVKIRILALGGGASNALNRAIRASAIDIPSNAANAEAQDLKRSLAPTRLLLQAPQIGAADRPVRLARAGVAVVVVRLPHLVDRAGGVLAGDDLSRVAVGGSLANATDRQPDREQGTSEHGLGHGAIPGTTYTTPEKLASPVAPYAPMTMSA